MSDSRRPLVLVDGRLARRRRTGVATYIRELDRALSAHPPKRLDVQFVYGPPGVPRRGHVTQFLNLALDLLWLHVLLPLYAISRRAALIHAPVNWAPWFSPARTIVTVQDLSFERMPDAYPRGFGAYARLFARRSARAANLVLATSQSTADDLTQLYGVPSDRIEVVPIGVHPGPPANAGLTREPFVLYVGEFEPRKRVPALIEGHRRYFAEHGSGAYRLVLAGGGGAEEERVRSLAGEGSKLTGFVSDAELLDLYRRASLLVMPSAYEGFGLPVAEAMANGCPVLVADNSALTEVGGDAAYVLDDPSPDGIAAALGRILAEPGSLTVRGQRAQAESARFGWDTVAGATASAYERALRS